MSSTCCLCGDEIHKANDSEEHLILAAIGGRKTVAGTVCRPCNQKTGHTWDAELARQLNPLSLFFRISRERRKTPRQVFITSADELIAVTPSGLELAKPTVEITRQDGQTNIRIQARDEAQARGILTGLKVKHPDIDVEATLAQGRSDAGSKYLDDYIRMEISIGGPVAGRSIVKSAYVLAASVGVNPADMEEARGYLLSDSRPSFGYIASRNDVVIDRPTETIMHCVGVQSCNGLLLGYIEYFSINKIVVCLSRSYRGPSINTIISIDPLIGKPLEVGLDMRFTEQELDDIYQYNSLEPEAVKAAYGWAIRLGMSRQLELEKPKAIDRAVARSLATLGKREGDEISPVEQVRLFALIGQELAPFLEHARRMGFVFTATPRSPGPPEVDPSGGSANGAGK